MKLSLKLKYGIACLHELAKIPEDHENSDALSQRLQIPPAYTHKILQTFARSGLVSARKGKGYKLHRALKDIQLLEVMDILSDLSRMDRVHPVFGLVVEKRVRDALKGITLEDVQAEEGVISSSVEPDTELEPSKLSG